MNPRSFDHLVNERKQVRRNFEAERLRGLEVNNKFELVYLLNRQLSRFHAFKNSTGVDTAFVIALTEHGSIAHQAADFDVLADFVKRRNSVTCRKRDNVLALTVEERVGANNKRIGPLLDNCRENLIEVVFSNCTQYIELDPKSARCGLRVLLLRRGDWTCWIDE